MAPRRVVLALSALVAATVAALLAVLRRNRPGVTAAPAAAVRRAAAHLPGVGGDAGPQRKPVEEWTCACGQVYRTTGEGRHRVYWPAGAPESEPVLGGQCVQCERPLPGEHVPAEQSAT